jgi:hypothetical protein
MNDLTKYDYYEIEKVLDIYAGMVNETLNRHCTTAINHDAISKIHETTENPMDDSIKQLHAAATHLKTIRDKLLKKRLNE